MRGVAKAYAEVGAKVDAISKVAFPGIIRNVTTRIDAAGDKIGRLVIEFRPEGNIVATLDTLHQPNAEVYVVLMNKAGE